MPRTRNTLGDTSGRKARADVWDFQVFLIPRPQSRCDVNKCKYDLESSPAQWGTFHRYRNPTGKEGYRTKVYCANHAMNFAQTHQLNAYSEGRPLGHVDRVNPSAAPKTHNLTRLKDEALAARLKQIDDQEGDTTE